MFYPEPKVGERVATEWGRMRFVKAVIRLGPNLFLVRYTNDKWGKSPVQTVSLWFMKPGDPNATYDRERIDTYWMLGDVKRNRQHYSLGRAIKWDVSTYHWYAATNPQLDWGRAPRVDGVLEDTDTNFLLAINMMVACAQFILPEEEFDVEHRVQDYGDITRS